MQAVAGQTASGDDRLNLLRNHLDDPWQRWKVGRKKWSAVPILHLLCNSQEFLGFFSSHAGDPGRSHNNCIQLQCVSRNKHTLEVCYKQSMKNCSWFFYFFCQINIQLFEQAARKLHGSKEGLRADDRYVRNVLTTHCNEEEHINHLTIVAARFAGWQSQEQVLILDDISWPRVQQLVRMHNQHRLPWGVNPSSILRQVKTSLLLFILDFSRGCNPKRTAFYIAARVAIQLYILTRLRRFLWALQRFSLFFDGEGVLSWIIRSAKWKLHSATWYGLHDIWGPHSETGHKIMVAEPTSMSLTMQSGQFARLHTPIPLFLQSFRCQPAQLGKVQEMPRCPFEIHFISVYDVHNDFIMFVSRNTLECAF